MAPDLFISYSWTSHEHREWVQLLAANLKAVGYDVMIDSEVDYGGSLSGFMREVTNCSHVLLVVDDVYVSKANTAPQSGVGKENYWLEQSYLQKPDTWLSVAFKDNPQCRLPDWLEPLQPKGFDFNSTQPDNDKPESATFPGEGEVEKVWRWIEGLPPESDHATRFKILRNRCSRLEKIDRERDPNSWTAPATEGEIAFEYKRAPKQSYTMGFGELRFVLSVSRHGPGQIYVYNDPVHAVGIDRVHTDNPAELAGQLTPGRYVEPKVGDRVILQNTEGALCLIELLDIRPEQIFPEYVDAAIRFRYRILTDS